MRSLSDVRDVPCACPRDRAADADRALLAHLLGFVMPAARATRLAETLIAERGSYPRVLTSAPSMLIKLGVPPKGLDILAIVAQSLERALFRELTHGNVLAGWQALNDYLHVSLAHSRREHFRVLFLNSRNALITDEEMGVGTVNQAPVYVREVMHRALDVGATALILVHNHPSGDPTPSLDDIRLTNHVRDAARVLGLQLHDHVVVSETGIKSFKTLGLL
ncbi:DNA repair protein RadC [Sphingosinicella sp.]|uniref:JAB domain-containing protein n=1 Tax=Sphingosinicella sp. TaxID=1917971 RepID=UPI0025D90DCC|nr:DNA repair protein RadC [Sphingosinicella sp.]